MLQNTIAPTELLDALQNRQVVNLLDVRSEGEFQEGALPGAINLPILNNDERHLVGLEYKKHGQDRAIKLGLQLVLPSKDQRVQSWCSVIDAVPTGSVAVTCWRGGLRSKTAAQWIQESGREVATVAGGYKALRNALLQVLENPPDLVVLAGWTGSGKTKLLQEIHSPKVDIEFFAHHRGSCFGERINVLGEVIAQPSQVTFENRLAFALWDKTATYVVEDESTRIGHLNLPKPLKEKLNRAPVVFLEASPAERARHIFEEYISQPLSSGTPLEKIEDFFLKRLNFIHRHLGGLEFQKMKDKMTLAFREGALASAHLEWIQELLVKHYDPSYQHAFQRLERAILFRGSYSECRDFLNLKVGRKTKMI